MTRRWGDVDEIVLGHSTGSALVVTEPLAVIAGYAFGSRDPGPNSRLRPIYGEEPPTQRARWGYRTYDCIPAADTSVLSGVDLTVAAGLNSRMNVDRVGALQAAADKVGECLNHLAKSPPFWELDRNELDEPTSRGTHEWWIGRAWYLLIRQADVGVAVTHKTLHHKRPKLFPLLDSVTRRHLPDGRAWATIHDDLASQAEGWAQLETDFAALIRRDQGEIELTRLRLHDILLWLTAKREDDKARKAGDSWRREGTS